MSKALSGYGGNVLNGTTDCDVQGWALTYATNTWDATTTADGGWDDTAPGTRNAKGSFDFLFNPDKQPHVATDAAEDPGLGLNEGDTIVALKLFVDKTGNLCHQGRALISNIQTKSVTKQGITLTASFESRGPWYKPGQTPPGP